MLFSTWSELETTLRIVYIENIISRLRNNKLGGWGEEWVEIDVDCLAVSYRNILEFFIDEGVDPKVIEKFHYNFSGQQVSYPMKLYDRELTSQKIKSIYRDNPDVDIRQLTAKYGFSTRWVKDVINENNKENGW